ncbi:MAG: DNA repair protein RadC [Alphaproteobacteria bacterium]|nr:DNA repair protein RadC [Alphaproteobacteria bacterium]
MAGKKAEAAEDAPHYLGHRQRLKERFYEAPDAFQEYELLELLLTFAIPRKDTKKLAKDLMGEFGSFGDVLGADRARLEAAGLPPNAVTLFKTTYVAAARLARAEARRGSALSSMDAVIAYCTTAMAHETIEQFRVLYLDRKNVLIKDEKQQGTVDHTPVYPRNVVKRALELSASALIIVHNHPSGDPTPSAADIDMTRQVKEACQKLGLVLHDHVVIGRGKHASFRTLGLL